MHNDTPAHYVHQKRYFHPEVVGEVWHQYLCASITKDIVFATMLESVGLSIRTVTVSFALTKALHIRLAGTLKMGVAVTATLFVVVTPVTG